MRTLLLALLAPDDIADGLFTLLRGNRHSMGERGKARTQ